MDAFELWYQRRHLRIPKNAKKKKQNGCLRRPYKQSLKEEKRKAKEKRPLYMLSTRDTPQTQGQIQTESEGLQKYISCNGDQKKAGVPILISDKIDFEIKAMKRDKKGHYIVIKGSIQEENITSINIYACNIRALQYVRKC